MDHKCFFSQPDQINLLLYADMRKVNNAKYNK